MAIEGTVDTLNIQVQTQGVAKAQKQLNSLVGTLKMFKRLGGTMTGVAAEAKEAGEDAKDASEDIAQAGETIEVTSEKAGRTSATMKKLGASFRSAGGDSEKSVGLFARLGASFKKTTSHIASFASALKRIAMYRFLRSVIKAITQAIGEGITNIYRYSQAVGTSLAPAMDRAKSATLTFKNSIGAALAPVLEALIPILVRVCNWLTTFNNLLAAIFAGLSGKSSYTAAVEATATWGDNLSSAAGAAKELKRQLLGFDELNVLNAPSSGGGGGGGASTPDYASMFEERNLPTGLFDWLQDFRLVFSDVVLDWSNINGEQLAEKIISGLFTLAGLIVGGVPGAIVGFLLSLFVNKFLFNRDGRIDGEELAKMIVTGLLGVGGAVAGGLIGGVPGAVIGFLLGVGMSIFLERKLFNNDGSISVEELDALIARSTFGILGGIFGLTVGGLPGLIIGFSLGLVLQPYIEKGAQKVKGFLSGIFGKDPYMEDYEADALAYRQSLDEQGWENVIRANESGSSSYYTWLDDFANTVNNSFSMSGTNAATSFVNSFNTSTKKNTRKLSATSGKSWQGVANGIVDILGNTDVDRSLSTIDNNLTKGMRIVKTGDRTRWVTESEYISDILGATDVTTPLQLIDSKMKYEWNTIQSSTDNSVTAVSKTISEKIRSTDIGNPMTAIKSTLSTSFDTIKTMAGTKMTEFGSTVIDKVRSTDIATPMNGMKDLIVNKFEEIKSSTTSTSSTISSNITTAFNSMKTNVISAVTAVKDGVASPLNAISNGAAQTAYNVAESVRQAIISMNNFKFTVPNWVNGYGGRSFSFNATVPQATKYVPMLMADGGIVDKGQLFIAREKGAELIGAYGHQTGVMNNEQIVDSVSEGVYRAVVEAMGDQSTTVQIDGKTLFEIITERNNAQVRRTGRSPLLV